MDLHFREKAGNTYLVLFILLYSPVLGLKTLGNVAKYLSDALSSLIILSEEKVWTVKCSVLIGI